ncbi:hypothetical protein OHB12_02865 [Nocardia sp. NBC_01730]|uniref:hypothetical protein n=1 Tax=Nocardia sp. NBC_01730 TaxID=2975998 RepID=UPI002E1003E0|nr:hypothetical protein OHB12_02865 [Nocardia sp. NBC_01730]
MTQNESLDVDTTALKEAGGALAEAQEALINHSRTAASLWGKFLTVAAGDDFSEDFIRDKGGQQGLRTQFTAVHDGNNSAAEVVGDASKGQVDAADSLKNVDIGSGHTIANTVPNVTVKG